MKSIDNLKTNERVEFVVDNESYKSSVQDIVSDSSIAISIPVSGHKSYIPYLGEDIEFIILIKDDYFKYKGKAGNRIIDGNLRLLIIEDLICKGKIQRREFYRIPISLDVEYITISKEAAERKISKKALEKLSNNFKTAKSIDLSAGGMKILTSENIELNTNIIVKIALGPNEDIFIISRVVRVEKDIKMKIYKLGCRFEILDKTDKERVVRFIFEKSREQMKR